MPGSNVVTLAFILALNFHQINSHQKNKDMRKTFTVKKLLMLFVALLAIVAKANANDTIKVRPNLYHIDHKKNIIIINQATSLFNAGASGLKKHLLLDDQYTFAVPTLLVNTSSSYRVENNDSVYTAFFTRLPIIHIDTKNQIADAPSVYARFSMSETSGAFTQSAVGIEIRGAYTQTLPKKSYELSFWNDTLGVNTSDVRLLNMRNDNKWNLQAMYNEPLRLQNKVSNELWQDIHQIYYKNLEPDAKNGIAMEYVELFINDEYKGVYALSERIDRKQLKLKKYDNQQIKGELYKGGYWGGAVTFSSLPPFDNTSLEWGGFEYKHPEEEISWNALYNFVDFVENSSDQYFNSHYQQQFKLDNAVDYFIFLNLLRATDNTGKNLYIAKYKAGEPYYYVPWDLDGVLGTDWQGLQVNVTNDILTNGFYTRLMQDCSATGFRSALVQRWAALRTNVITENNILAKITSNNSYLINNNAYERENIAWSGFQYDATQLTYVSNWLRNRLSYLDVVFSQSCTPLSSVQAADKTIVELKMYPNPANGYVMIDCNASSYEVCIQDMNGRVVLRTKVGSKVNKIDIKDLPKGVYVVIVKNDKLIKAKKLLVD